MTQYTVTDRLLDPTLDDPADETDFDTIEEAVQFALDKTAYLEGPAGEGDPFEITIGYWTPCDSDGDADLVNFASWGINT